MTFEKLFQDMIVPKYPKCLQDNFSSFFLELGQAMESNAELSQFEELVDISKQREEAIDINMYSVLRI